MLSTPLILGCLWVVAAAVTATLPMRLQRYPGLPLVLAAPVLLVWIGRVHGWMWLGFGLFAVVSMFRRPLDDLARKALGLPVHLPPEPEELREARK
jgi:hypothetical protein